MASEQSYYNSIVSGFKSDVLLLPITDLPQPQRDFHFAMRCNGYFLLDNGDWKFSSNPLHSLKKSFEGQNVSFFGPGSNGRFFNPLDTDRPILGDVFTSSSAIDVIRRHRDFDTGENTASRLAFIFGGISRQLATPNPGFSRSVAEVVDYASRMTRLGETKSAEAVASAIAMYIFSIGGEISNKQFLDQEFKGQVFHMADSIRRDPIVLRNTTDLGLSQVARLRAFQENIQFQNPTSFPDMEEELYDFGGFPTVGAEFHFPLDSKDKYPKFWERLALLNMSQYHPGNYVQMSRNDRDIIEVRMNPSIYPVTIANWMEMRKILPELDKAFFHATINRNEGRNFSWNDSADKILLNELRAVGMLRYATHFQETPPKGSRQEIPFGGVYLGQTVKVLNDEYNFDGNWGNHEGIFGQMSIYSGFGKNFPDLMYYLSMVLQKPDILGSYKRDLVPKIKTLTDALALDRDKRIGFFREIRMNIRRDSYLNRIDTSGREIMSKLINP